MVVDVALKIGGRRGGVRGDFMCAAYWLSVGNI